MNILDFVKKETIEKIKNLDVKSETTDLDYKEIFLFKERKAQLELVKDMAAFANTKGGYLIFGVTKDYAWVGLDERSDNKPDDCQISQLISEYIDGAINFICNDIEINNQVYFTIYIESSLDILPFKKDGQYSKTKWGNSKIVNENLFHKGDVYCRRNSRSIKADNLFFKQKSKKFKIIENVTEQTQLYSEFVGRNVLLKEIYSKLINKNNRILQIDGIGGIGKTAFVHYFCTLLIEDKSYTSDFEFIIWMSAKRNKYTPGGIKQLQKFLTDYKDVIDEIYYFMENNSLLDYSLDGAEEFDDEFQVKKFLENNKVLLVIDNMETLIDTDLNEFLINLPISTKAILTTRESIGDFYMARVTLTGFEPIAEFPEFMESQYKFFTSGSSFKGEYSNYVSQLYDLTKGMPLAGQLICHQLSLNLSINKVIENLNTGKSYGDILEFCFKGSIDRLSDVERDILYIFSLSEKDELLSEKDIEYISGYSSDDIGVIAIPKLTKISLCLKQRKQEGEFGYTIPYLAKIYMRQYDAIPNKEKILDKYEKFISEKDLIDDISLNNEKLFIIARANKHDEKIVTPKALHALTMSNYDYDKAIQLIDSLIGQCPKFPYLHYIKGKIENQSNFSDSYNNAKKSFQTAIDLNNDYVDAFVELGYLELKRRSFKKERYMDLLNNSIRYFEKALKVSTENERANLGLGMALFAKANSINVIHNKFDKLKTARLANEYFKKAYYQSDKLTYTQSHSNAIAAYNHALNMKNNFRDYKEAIKICEQGLTYEPNNRKLKDLKIEALDYVKPRTAKERFEEKGWLFKSNRN